MPACIVTLVTPSVLFVCAVPYFGSVLLMSGAGCCVDPSCLQMAISGGCLHADTVSWLADPPGLVLLSVLLSAEGMFGRVLFFFSF